MNSKQPAAHRPDRAPSGIHLRRCGFSFIEVISAIAILSILVMLIGRLFADAQQSMQVGLRAAEVNSNARAVLEFMARDIQTAMFDDASTSAEKPYLLLVVKEAPTLPANTSYPSDGTYLGLNPAGGRELGFVAPIHRPGTPSSTPRRRETKIVGYRMRRQRMGSANIYLPHRYELMRGEFFDDTTANNMTRYNDPDWFAGTTNDAYDTAVVGNSEVMIQNVRSVLFNFVTDVEGTNLAIFENPEVRTDNSADPLAFLDIHLELLSSQDARRAADLFALGGGASAPNVAFVERAVRRYHQRIFFFNAQGYYRPNR